MSDRSPGRRDARDPRGRRGLDRVPIPTDVRGQQHTDQAAVGRDRKRVPIPTDGRGEQHTGAPAGSTWARSAATVRGALGLVAALAVWWLVTDVVAAPGDLLARFSPTAAVPALLELFRSGNGLLHMVVTVERLLIGLGAAIVVGVPLGVAVGRSATLAQYTGALFQFLRMVSPLAWTPIAIIVLGVGDAPVYFLVAVAAVWPVLLNAAAGVHALDPGWLQVSRSLGATRTEQLRTIVLPGIRAHLATGVRVALGTAWIVIVPAEMLGVDSGLGYAILDARDRLRYDELMGVILVIGVLGFTLDSLAKRLAVRSSRRRRPTPVPAGTGDATRAGGDDAAGAVEAARGPISRR
jgi:NitT/TauT family transport system permease protein